MSDPKDPILPVLPPDPGGNSPGRAPEDPGPSSPGDQGGRGGDDAGSLALSEALRSSFTIVKVIMLVLIIVFFGSGIFTVPSNEKAVVLRFGRPVGTLGEQLLGPGLHFSMPRPIDEVVRIPIGEFQTVTSTVGWYATTPEAEAANNEPSAGPSLNPVADGYTMTADGNIIHVRATLHYRIADPLTYVLKFVNASNVVQNALNNALFEASSRFNVDAVLRHDQAGFKERLTLRVRQLIEEHGLGITVEQMDVRSRAPRQVQDAFDRVFASELERQKAVADARSYANRVLSTAKGEATGVLDAGKTDRTRLVQSVAAEAKYFQNQLPYYKANPELFRERLVTELMGRVLTNAEDKWFIPTAANGKTREFRVQLSREPIETNVSTNAPGQ